MPQEYASEQRDRKLQHAVYRKQIEVTFSVIISSKIFKNLKTFTYCFKYLLKSWHNTQTFTCAGVISVNI